MSRQVSASFSMFHHISASFSIFQQLSAINTNKYFFKSKRTCLCAKRNIVCCHMVRISGPELTLSYHFQVPGTTIIYMPKATMFSFASHVLVDYIRLIHLHFSFSADELCILILRNRRGKGHKDKHPSRLCYLDSGRCPKHMSKSQTAIFSRKFVDFQCNFKCQMLYPCSSIEGLT